LYKKILHTIVSGLACMALLGGCALLPSTRTERIADEEATPTPIPTPIVPVKPTYTVERGEIVNELEFSGRISPVVEEELFFRANGRVRAVFNSRNDFVTEGQVIAELEIEALERELEAAELELERARVRFDQAQGDWEYAMAVAQADLEIAQLQLAAMQSHSTETGRACPTRDRPAERGTRPPPGQRCDTR
jgi:multidrug efflux pump subunit AcrA (membrane-fusion protein)